MKIGDKVIRTSKAPTFIPNGTIGEVIKLSASDEPTLYISVLWQIPFCHSSVDLEQSYPCDSSFHSEYILLVEKEAPPQPEVTPKHRYLRILDNL
jgi:hypothetical protein